MCPSILRSVSVFVLFSSVQVDDTRFLSSSLLQTRTREREVNTNSLPLLSNLSAFSSDVLAGGRALQYGSPLKLCYGAYLCLYIYVVCITSIVYIISSFQKIISSRKEAKSVS